MPFISLLHHQVQNTFYVNYSEISSYTETEISNQHVRWRSSIVKLPLKISWEVPHSISTHRFSISPKISFSSVFGTDRGFFGWAPDEAVGLHLGTMLHKKISIFKHWNHTSVPSGAHIMGRGLREREARAETTSPAPLSPGHAVRHWRAGWTAPAISHLLLHVSASVYFSLSDSWFSFFFFLRYQGIGIELNTWEWKKVYDMLSLFPIWVS